MQLSARLLSSLCKALDLTPVLTKKARLSLVFMETWIQDSLWIPKIHVYIQIMIQNNAEFFSCTKN